MPGRLFIEEHSTGRKEKVLLKLHNFSQNSSCLMSNAPVHSRMSWQTWESLEESIASELL